MDTDTITLSHLHAYHAGTVTQLVYATSPITFDFGSLGSNAASDNLGASEWHYLYIDDSALSGAIITAARLINTTTAPTWNAAKMGWYNGNDLCLCGFLTDGSNNIIKFVHDGTNYMAFDEAYSAYSLAYPGTGWTTTVTMRAPSFCTLTYATVDADPNNTVEAYSVYIRHTGSSGAGHLVGKGYRSGASDAQRYITFNALNIPTNASQSIDIRVSLADGNAKMRITQHGWYFPKGM